MTRLIKPELVTTGYATSIKITSTPATHAAIRIAIRSRLGCFSMVSESIVAIRRYLLTAWGHCVSGMTRAAVFASRIYPFLHCLHRIIQFKSEPKERIGRISIFEQGPTNREPQCLQLFH